MDTVTTIMRQYVDISDEQAAQIEAIALYKTYQKNEYIFTPDSTCRHIYLLLNGLVRCFYVYDDKEVNLRLLCETSAVMAYSSYIEQIKTGEYVQALEPCKGYLLARKDLENLSEHVPAISKLKLQTAERHYISMERRLLTIQLKTAEERIGYFYEHMESAIVERTPALHVASYLGMTPESFSRAKRNLNK